MLTQLHIRNFAIVDRLTLEFGPGMTVLTGETGAGKSILLDALGLALGDRADSALLRPGSERAEISVSFEVGGLAAVEAWLHAHELDADGECILRRTLSADGRSRGYINGQPQPIQALRELGEQLVDIHGQHAHQSLLKREVQRQLLDAYAGHDALLEELGRAYAHWRQLNEELQRLSAARDQREARLELLRYQVQELEQLELRAEELAELDDEHARLANGNRLLEGGQRALARLHEDDEQALLALLERTLGELQELAALDPRLENSCELLEGAAIQGKEAASELRHYLDGLDLDPQRLEWVEQRLGAIHDLARKHHCQPEELPALLEQMQTELAELEQAGTRLDGLENEIAQARDGYRELAARLSAGRQRAAAQLAKAITANMQQLGMKEGRFAIELEANADDAPAAYGMERPEYRVSANPGQPLRPLSKVASGGELSRISLAIQVIAAGKDTIPTLIFDEVDVGVGGGVAEMVGRQLHTLGQERQVLCVTHQPQVAAQGRQHYRILKQSDKANTRTEVEPLDEAARVEEIARMLGGVEITEQTRAHARELLALAREPRPEGGQRKKA